MGGDEGRALAMLVKRADAADCAGASRCDLAGWMGEDLAPFADHLVFSTEMADSTRVIDEDVSLADRKIEVVLEPGPRWRRVWRLGCCCICDAERSSWVRTARVARSIRICAKGSST